MNNLATQVLQQNPFCILLVLNNKCLQVVPITNPEVKRKIHQSYRMGYLKDVVLPRVSPGRAWASLSVSQLLRGEHELYALRYDCPAACAALFPGAL